MNTQKLEVLSKTLQAQLVHLSYLFNELGEKLEEALGEETREPLEEAYSELDQATDLMARALELLQGAAADKSQDEAEIAPALGLKVVGLLLDDALRLLGLGDLEGALVSLDRLIALSDPASSWIVQGNLRKGDGETAAMSLYLSSCGIHSRVVPHWNDDGLGGPGRILGSYPRVRAVIKFINGQVCVEELSKLAKLSLLETIAVVSLLKRIGAVWI